jgi:hypothetical protein
MHRVKWRRYPEGKLYKQYLIENNRLNKSDRILITALVGLQNDVFATISYRKLFVKKINNNWGVYRVRNTDFQNWIIMKRRSEKLNRIKLKIHG